MNYLETLQASPVWEKFLLHAYYLKFPKTDLSRDNKIECKSATSFLRNSFPDLTEVFQLAALVDWLDTEGVYVTTNPLTTGMFNYEITSKAGEIIMQYDYTSRPEALKAGVIKGFEILEKKPAGVNPV